MADETFTKEQVDALLAERVASEVAGLKASQAELLKEAKAARAKAAQYEGVDPSEYKALKEAAEKAEREKQEGAGNFKALEDQLHKKYGDIIKAKDSEKDEALSFLDRSLKDSAAISELAKHSDVPDLLLPHVLKQMKVVKEDGEYVARIIDSKGNVRVGKGQGSGQMTLPELMDEMKANATYALAFRGSGSSGGGAAKSHAGGGSSKTFNPATATGADFLKAMDGLANKSITVTE